MHSWRQQRGSASSRRADELFARAEQLVAAEPTSDRTGAAAREAIEVAEGLPGVEDTPKLVSRVRGSLTKAATVASACQMQAFT
jgi:hypothetical protein